MTNSPSTSMPPGSLGPSAASGTGRARVGTGAKQRSSLSGGSPRIRIPALELRSPYSSRLSSRSAIYGALHQLLSNQRDLVSGDALRALVLDENVLLLPTVASRRKTWKELHSRYILNGDSPLFQAFWAEWHRAGSEAERTLVAYILFALQDRLVAEIGMDFLAPRLRSAPAELRVEDLEAWVRLSTSAHPELASWTPTTQRRVVQHYLASIRDFGLATGVQRKFTRRPALYGAPVRLLFRALRLAGLAPLAAIQSPLFRLLALEGAEVVDALGELNRQGELRFRMQADVIELDLDPVP